MPRTSLRAHAVDAMPDAKKAVTYLEKNGQPALAAAVSTVMGFAQESIDAQTRAARRDAELDPAVSLFVTEAFKNHVKAAQDPKKPLAKVVTPYLNKFLRGKWTPPAPPGVPVVPGVVPTLKRAPRGAAPAKSSLSVRIPQELFDKVDARAKDPARAAERGYALNGRMVMIAALAEEFGVPDEALTGAKAK